MTNTTDTGELSIKYFTRYAVSQAIGFKYEISRGKQWIKQNYKRWILVGIRFSTIDAQQVRLLDLHTACACVCPDRMQL